MRRATARDGARRAHLRHVGVAGADVLRLDVVPAPIDVEPIGRLRDAREWARGERHGALGDVERGALLSPFWLNGAKN